MSLALCRGTERADPFNLSHSRTVCRQHGTVLHQCRCIDKNKINYSIDCPGEPVCDGRRKSVMPETDSIPMKAEQDSELKRVEGTDSQPCARPKFADCYYNVDVHGIGATVKITSGDEELLDRLINAVKKELVR